MKNLYYDENSVWLEECDKENICDSIIEITKKGSIVLHNCDYILQYDLCGLILLAEEYFKE